MARAINRLTARTVATLKEPGLHADGAGLYLRIDQAGARRWVLIYHHLGKRREMGLGSAATVDLRSAREAAGKARALPDPIAAKRQAEAPLHTFESVMDTLYDDLEGGWREGKHKAQWRSIVTRHGAPLLAKPVADVSTEDVLGVLRPVWTKRPETARRLRQRVEKVLDAARVRQLRGGENPARWKGHLELLLARQPRLVRGHHKAMPWREIPAFMARLRQRQALAARALEFTILTCVRTSEALGAAWAEMSGDEWSIPGERMKGGKAHRVPMSDEAMEARGEQFAALLFPGEGMTGRLSTAAMGSACWTAWAWGAATRLPAIPCTASAPRSETGRPSAPASPARWSKPPSPTLSETTWSWPTSAPTSLRSGARSWSSGPSSAVARPRGSSSPSRPEHGRPAELDRPEGGKRAGGERRGRQGGAGDV